MSDDMLALAARVEALDGADYETDLAIATWCYKNGAVAGVNYNPALWLERNGGEFTASIDAAITLITTESFWRVGHDADDPAWMTAQVSYDRGEGRLGFTTGTAKTPALALCAASLRARASMGGE